MSFRKHRDTLKNKKKVRNIIVQSVMKAKTPKNENMF